MNEIPASPCPGCGHVLDAATGANTSDAPVPDDLTICIRCASFLRFDSAMRLAMLTVEEVANLPDGVRILLQRARRVIEATNRDRQVPHG